MQPPPLMTGHPLPLLVTPATTACASVAEFCAWLGGNRAALNDWLHQAGVVLLRGFPVDSAAAFHAVAKAIHPNLRDYRGGDSPRHKVQYKIYTSTEYAAALEVLLHNELSYAGWSPDRVFFGCLLPASQGGETPVADGRAILQALPDDIRARFEARRVTYLQHLRGDSDPGGPGKSWQETFETPDRRQAEDYCRESGMTFEWTGLGLRTAAPHPAVLEHPVTGAACWHNQADQWHREMPSVKDCVPGAEVAVKTGTEGEAGLGNHVTYGDGSEISVEDLRTIRAVSRGCEVVFPWQAGDVMVIDNVLAMHGRKPYAGERRVLVAMG